MVKTNNRREASVPSCFTCSAQMPDSQKTWMTLVVSCSYHANSHVKIFTTLTHFIFVSISILHAFDIVYATDH